MKGSTNRELRELMEQHIGSMDIILERLDNISKTQSHLIDMINHHEKEIDKLQMLAEPMKTKIPTECKWIGYLCKFKDRCNEEWQCYSILESVDYASTEGMFEDKVGTHWQECEIVKLTDPEVYKVKPEDVPSLSKAELDLLEKEFKLKSGF